MNITNKKGDIFTSEIRYFIKEISADGLLKDIQDSSGWRGNPFSEYLTIDDAKKAIDKLNEVEIKNDDYRRYTNLAIIPMYICNAKYK